MWRKAVLLVALWTVGCASTQEGPLPPDAARNRDSGLAGTDAEPFVIVDSGPINTIDAPMPVPDSAVIDAPIVIVDAAVDAPLVFDARPPDAAQPADAAIPPDGCADFIEVCNGLDDNCNGSTDEGFELGVACVEGTGACRREGVTECAPSGLGTRCSVRAGEPVEELCGNGIDDDCDTMIDEGFDLGVSCTVGVGACSRTGVKVCGPGGVGTVCGIDPGNPAPVELCGNFTDDDCDTMIDEGFDVGAMCTAGTGICARTGFKVCSADRTTTECNAVAGTPGPVELCGNGLDDDCDGTPDEGFDVGADCSAGVGVCARTGKKVCTADMLGTECNAVPGASVPEICGNGLDDDCDGTPDDGFDVGAPCTNGMGACQTSGVKVCTANGAGTECNAIPGQPGGTEICGNGSDDNCNGQTDEGYDVGAPCTVGLGICARTGVKVCTALGTGTECNVQPGQPAPSEICGNGLDDDCDGVPDDGFDVGAPCSAGIGACLRPGTKVCTANGAGTECNAVAGTPGANELCLNAIDDDCDGMTDEGFSDLGQACSVGLGICRRDGAWLCTPGDAALHCSATPGPANPVELCDNTNPVDDDCDGMVDEGFEMKGAVCFSGVGACTSAGNMVCTANKLGLACNAVPLPPGTELCGNGIDDDCDTMTDEGFDVGTLCDGADADLCLEGMKVCSANRLTTICNDFTGDALELCDGIDNDCNPSTVDGSQDPNLGALCDSTSDSDFCLEGNRFCSGGGLQCSDPGNDNTTNDPDNCGACGAACANPHGSRSCTNSNCTPSCSSGWQACGNPALGCLSLRDTNPGCEGSNLGSIDGDGTGGGDGGSNHFTRSAYDERKYKFHVHDTTDNCLDHDSVGVKVTFTNPPGAVFRVCTGCVGCATGTEICKTPVAGGSAEITISRFENCPVPFGDPGDDDHDEWLRIDWMSSDNTSCGNWTLDIQGNQDNLHDETCGGDT